MEGNWLVLFLEFDNTTKHARHIEIPLSFAISKDHRHLHAVYLVALPTHTQKHIESSLKPIYLVWFFTPKIRALIASWSPR